LERVRYSRTVSAHRQEIGGRPRRALLGEVQLLEEDGAMYAECDNAAERLLLAVGGVSMGLVAGEGFEPSTFGL
jgi:hypothetical protein